VIGGDSDQLIECNVHLLSVMLFKQMDKAQGINPDLDKERRKANIDVERVSLVLYGNLLQKKRAVGLL